MADSRSPSTSQPFSSPVSQAVLLSGPFRFEKRVSLLTRAQRTTWTPPSRCTKQPRKVGSAGPPRTSGASARRSLPSVRYDDQAYRGMDAMAGSTPYPCIASASAQSCMMLYLCVFTPQEHAQIPDVTYAFSDTLTSCPKPYAETVFPHQLDRAFVKAELSLRQNQHDACLNGLSDAA